MADIAACLDRWAHAAETLRWHHRWDTVRDDAPPPGSWFVGGQLNVAGNCLDRHLPGRAASVAVHWEGEPGDRRTLSYQDLHAETCAFAGSLEALGVRAGDRVALYLGLVPELVVAMLACARLGAVFCTMPVPLPVETLSERLGAFGPRVLVTQDGAWRHGMVLPLKSRADEALAATGTVEHVVVVRRTGIDVVWYDSDRWYHELPSGAVPSGAPPPFPADHPLLVHHVPGGRGSRGVVHRSAGLLVHATVMHRHGLTATPDDVFWCAMEVAAVAGTTHGVLGPLACGATSVMFEGMLDTPTRTRTWQIVERYGVGSLLTFPTVVDRLRRWSGGGAPEGDISSLRHVVTGGEPLEVRDRQWLTGPVGGGRLRVVDGWGQTELGGIVALTPAPVDTGQLPHPGLDVVDPAGEAVGPGHTGELVLRHPWAGTFLTVEGEEQPGERYWARCQDGILYRSGDLARREPDGAITVLGRLDPFVKVTGQLVSTASVTEVLCQHPLVRAADVMQVPDPDGGRVLIAWVVPDSQAAPSVELASDLCRDLHEMLGGLAVPHAVAFVEDFPAELSPAERRQALAALAAQTPSRVFSVSAGEVRAAAARGAEPG